MCVLFVCVRMSEDGHKKELLCLWKHIATA